VETSPLRSIRGRRSPRCLDDLFGSHDADRVALPRDDAPRHCGRQHRWRGGRHRHRARPVRGRAARILRAAGRPTTPHHGSPRRQSRCGNARAPCERPHADGSWLDAGSNRRDRPEGASSAL